MDHVYIYIEVSGSESGSGRARESVQQGNRMNSSCKPLWFNVFRGSLGLNSKE